MTFKSAEDLDIKVIIEKSDVSVYGKMPEYLAIIDCYVVGTDGDFIQTIPGFSTHSKERHRVALGTICQGARGFWMEVPRHFDRNDMTVPRKADCRRVKLYKRASDRFEYLSPSERRALQSITDAIIIRCAPQHASIFRGTQFVRRLMTDIHNECVVLGVMEA